MEKKRDKYPLVTQGRFVYSEFAERLSALQVRFYLPQRNNLEIGVTKVVL